MKHALRSVALVAALAAVVVVACGKPPELSDDYARKVILDRAIDDEPVYAEVPETVWWSPESPKDDYDELALRTLRNLESAGLVTLAHEVDGATESWTATVTERGFPILGRVPSKRGRALRAKICAKKIDDVRNFIRHPSDPAVGSADLVWHYEQPTVFYEMFETKRDKPLGKPFRSVVSIRREGGFWKLDLIIRKAELSGEAAEMEE
jgi:hypothetical protein